MAWHIHNSKEELKEEIANIVYDVFFDILTKRPNIWGLDLDYVKNKLVYKLTDKHIKTSRYIYYVTIETEKCETNVSEDSKSLTCTASFSQDIDLDIRFSTLWPEVIREKDNVLKTDELVVDAISKFTISLKTIEKYKVQIAVSINKVWKNPHPEWDITDEEAFHD